MSSQESQLNRLLDADLTRRRLLKAAGAGLLSIGGASLLEACGSSAGSSSASSSASGTSLGGKVVRGGTLTLGGSGGGANDTLDGQNALSNTDFARALALFDPLTAVDNKGAVVNVLAESFESNKSGDQWTIRLHPGIKTHAGKSFGAADVLFSLNRIVAKKYPGAVSFGPINLKAAKVMDPRTLRVSFHSPYAIFPEALVLTQSVMVPIGFDPKHPIGTGPFKYQSFTPGRSSTFVRNDDYWISGKPYLDTLIITNYSDETAQVNALQSGQVDAIDYLSATSVAAVKGAHGQVVIAKTGAWGPVTMRVDKAPFTDVRVRQALRLVVNRPQMLEQVYGGYGNIANDLWGTFDPAFDHALPQRVQDIEQAKSLLKAAGQSDLQLQLVTTANAPGQVQAAQVFATQAQAAGVKTNITNQAPTQYFANSYLKVPFSQDYWPYQPYLVATGQATVAGAPFSATHQDNPHYDKLYAEAVRTLDSGKRTELIHELLKYDYTEGGNIIPYNFPVIDGLSAKVRGVEASVTGVALGNFDWKNVWKTA